MAKEVKPPFVPPTMTFPNFVEVRPSRAGKGVPMLVIGTSGENCLCGWAFYPNHQNVSISQAWHENDPYIAGEAGVKRLVDNDTGVWRELPITEIINRADELKALLDAAPALMRALNNRKPAKELAGAGTE